MCINNKKVVEIDEIIVPKAGGGNFRHGRHYSKGETIRKIFFCFIKCPNFITFSFQPIFLLLNPPDLKFKKPSWLVQPSANTVLFFVLVSYFLVTGGLIYDVIVEPPSIGSTTDEHGHSRPVAFMQYRING